MAVYGLSLYRQKVLKILGASEIPRTVFLKFSAPMQITDFKQYFIVYFNFILYILKMNNVFIVKKMTFLQPLTKYLT